MKLFRHWQTLSFLSKAGKVTILGKTLQVIRQNKVLWLYALVPVLLGLFLYGLAGAWGFNDLLPWVRDYIEQVIAGRIEARWLYYFVAGLIGILSFFIVNWTFVLMVGLLALPFNDLIAGHVLHKVYHLEEVQRSGNFFQRSMGLLFNELKKILFIGIVFVFSIAIGIIPILMPVSIFFSVILVFISLSDYSWSRLNWPAKRCAQYIIKNLLGNVILGIFFIIMLSIPGVNLFALPFGVIAASVRLGEISKNAKGELTQV